PTDTVWGIGCDATNADAVQKIYALKKRPDSKALICLVANFEMLEKYIPSISPAVYQILAQSSRPTTVIYHNPTGVAHNLVSEDNTLAIRICNTEFCQQLFTQFKKPIVSTSANISGQPTARSFKQISAEITEGVDYVVNLQHEEENTQPS